MADSLKETMLRLNIPEDQAKKLLKAGFQPSRLSTAFINAVSAEVNRELQGFNLGDIDKMTEEINSTLKEGEVRFNAGINSYYAKATDLQGKGKANASA
jgi:hypothetical protein